MSQPVKLDKNHVAMDNSDVANLDEKPGGVHVFDSHGCPPSSSQS